MSDDTHLHDLVARWLDGTSTVVEVSELDALLRRDPRAAAVLVAASRLEGALVRVHRASMSADDAGITARIALAEVAAAQRSGRRRASPPRRTRATWLPHALAAVLVAGLGTLAWLSLAAPDAAPFSQDGRPLVAGAGLSGTVELAGGGTVRLDGGARARSAGTAAEPQLHLDQGEAVCTVAPRPQGTFTIATPHGAVQVVGTRFTVTVGERTQVVVAQGTVQARGSVGAPVRVGPGMVAVLAPGQIAQTFGPILHQVHQERTEDWNNSSTGTQVAANGTGPTGATALRLTIAGSAYPWAGMFWPTAAPDWRSAAGLSLVVRGQGSGRPFQVELIDNGDPKRASGRDGCERFVADARDDNDQWRELRIPFRTLRRRPIDWPRLPDDGLTLSAVHGLSLIAVDGKPLTIDVERIGTYVER